MRYFLDISYKGTNYHGWQIQPNAITVQEVIQKALQVLFKEKIEVTGSGRTDAGVHAYQQVAHFNLEKEIELEKVHTALNGILPKDICINKISPVTAQAHARFNACNRGYVYEISKRKTPFRPNEYCLNRRGLNVLLMNKAAQELLNFSDFECFSKIHTDVKTFICDIRKAEWIETDHQIYFYVEADRFLRGMIRAIVGTLFEIGLEKMTIEEFRSIIQSKNRSLAGASAPAAGLFLNKVEYPSEVYL